MTRSVVSLALTLALVAATGAGCKSKDQAAGKAGQTGDEATSEVSAEPVDPSEVPEDVLSKLFEGAPEKMSAKSACVRLWLGKTSYMCCSWSGGMSCQPLKSQK